MTFSDFIRVLRARWILAAATFLVVVTLALIASLLWPKTYAAKAAVLVDMKLDPVAGTSAAGLMPSTAYLATQIDIIESGYVAQRVVRTLQLDQNPKMRTEWESVAGARGDYLAWLGDKLLTNLKVETARESNVIEISYDSVDPKFSATLANAFAKAYIDSTVQFRTSPAKQYSDFFEERARTARHKMEQAQSKLAEAQKQKGILVTDEKLDAETTKLADLSAQLTSLRGVVVDASSRKAQAALSGEVSPDAMASTIITTLKSDLAKQEARLDESLQRYGDSHPQIVELRANIASTRAKIRAEVGRVSSSLSANDKISTSREAAIKVAYEEQRQKLLKLKEDRNDLLVLEREMQAAQRVYDAIQSRQSQMSLEGSNGQTNVVILNTAAEPANPTSPKVGMNMALATLLGLALAAGAALIAEFLDRKVRGLTDLVSSTHLPVIGYLPTPTSRSRFGLRRGLPALSVGRLELISGNRSNQNYGSLD